jgi:putative transposase
MTQDNINIIENIFKELDANDSGVNLPQILSTLINVAMKIERDKVLQVEPYERSESRTGHRNGFKNKTVKTRIGEIDFAIPQVRGDVEFYPKSLEKGCRSERALKLAIAQMYIQGVSTRKVAKITEELCGFSVSQSQVTEATKILDVEIENWRKRTLGRYQYLIVDATYENVRMSGTVVSGAVLVAFGVDHEGQRSVLGVSTEISEADVHWRKFLQSLVARGLHGIEMIVSDAHEGLKSARKAVFPTVAWQRCQFHLQQNSVKHVPKVSMRQEVHGVIRNIFNAPNKEEAERYLNIAIEKYKKEAPRLAEWMETAIPESLTVFVVPEKYRKKLRTSNMAERQMKEIKRRTKIASIFPNTDSVNRLVSAILMETDETWKGSKRYLPEPE